MYCKHQSYVICQKITNENIHFNNNVVKYLNNSSNIDFLNHDQFYLVF